MKKPNTQTVFLGSAILVVCVMVAYIVLIQFQRNGAAGTQRRDRRNILERAPVDGEAMFQWIKDICELGRRPSGSEGMAAQQKMLTKHFEKLGGKVQRQTFEVRHPEDGSKVEMTNLIIRWHPERKERILLCAHYDTRPYPDADPNPSRRKGRFIGANDGASGVAVLCELGRHMPKLESRYGVDFVLFDGEEFIFDADRDKYFLGSTHFAKQYASGAMEHTYVYGVLLDMVGDRYLNLPMERNSLKLARQVVVEIWHTAKDLGIREFIHRAGYELRDDHLPLNNIAKIPTCDIIDFGLPPSRATGFLLGHTEADTPDKCVARVPRQSGMGRPGVGSSARSRTLANALLGVLLVAFSAVSLVAAPRGMASGQVA